MYAGLVAICCFIAFWFLLLVSISVPTVKTIYLFYLTTTVVYRDGPLGIGISIPLRINFGVWGYCVPAFQFQIVELARFNTAYCSPPHLGWTFDSGVANYLSASRTLENAITAATTIALVLNPIATGLTFVTFVLSLLLLWAKHDKPQRIGSLVVLICCILAVTLTTIAFLVDIIVASVLRSKVRDATDGLVFVNYGNAIWLILLATIALWFAIAGACYGVFLQRKQRKPNTNTY